MFHDDGMSVFKACVSAKLESEQPIERDRPRLVFNPDADMIHAFDVEHCFLLLTSRRQIVKEIHHA
jgi:hypothetical protein